MLRENVNLQSFIYSQVKTNTEYLTEEKNG